MILRQRRQSQSAIPFVLFLTYTLFPVHVSAQQGAFVWGFNDFNGTTLPQCATLAIFVDPSLGTVKPAPPYTIIAYESGTFPTVQGIGDTVGNLNWVVDHKSGSTLILGIVDSNGNSGGILSDQYTVQSSSNTSCLPSPPSSNSNALTATTNATSSLNTCDSIQINIKNGKKPYVVTVAETNTPTSMNFTGGVNDDTFVWVNNLSPGNQVILAISDSANAYTPSTPIMKLAGTSNTKCSQQSRFSSSSNSSSGSSKIPIIVGIIVAIAFIAILGLIAWFILVKRKQKKQKRWSALGGEGDGHDGIGRGRVIGGGPSENDLTPFQLPPPPVPFTASASSRESASSKPYPHSLDPNSTFEGEAGYQRESAYSGTDHSGYFNLDGYDRRSNPYMDASSSALTSPHPNTQFLSPQQQQQDPFSTLRSSTSTRYRDNVPESPLHNPHSHFGESVRSSAQGSSFRAVNPDRDAVELNTARLWSESKASGGAGGSGGDTASTTSRVFQHQDAGMTVEEIPPAYPGPSGSSGGSGSDWPRDEKRR